jgi:hypothetical protein
VTYELKLRGTARVVSWEGDSPEDAALRYVDRHPDAVVLAWRRPRHGLVVGLPRYWREP